MKSWEKIEQLLMTIDQLGAATIKQIRGIHDLKTYRNACYMLKQLEPYTNTTFHNREKVFYLNKSGRDLIGSSKEFKVGQKLEHTLLRNDVYIYLNCPFDWQSEKVLEYASEQPNLNGIIIRGVNVATKKKIVSDGYYKRNGYTYIVEIDNKRDMKDNHKKIVSYAECFKYLDTPRLSMYTHTLDRQRKLTKWMNENKVPGEVKLYEEIK